MKGRSSSSPHSQPGAPKPLSRSDCAPSVHVSYNYPHANEPVALDASIGLCLSPPLPPRLTFLFGRTRGFPGLCLRPEAGWHVPDAATRHCFSMSSPRARSPPPHVPYLDSMTARHAWTRPSSCGFLQCRDPFAPGIGWLRMAKGPLSIHAKISSHLREDHVRSGSAAPHGGVSVLPRRRTYVVVHCSYTKNWIEPGANPRRTLHHWNRYKCLVLSTEASVLSVLLAHF